MADEISQKRIIQVDVTARSNTISQKLILQTDMYHIDKFDYEYFSSYAKYSYFYAIDTGKLFRAINGDEFTSLIPSFDSINNISIMTYQEFLESESIVGHYYYVLNYYGVDLLLKCATDEEGIVFYAVDSLLSEEKVYITASDYDRRFSVEKIVGKKYYCVDTNQLWLYKGADKWEYVAGDLSIEYQDTGFYEGNLIFTKSETFNSNGNYVTTKVTKVNNVVFGKITKANVEGIEQDHIASMYSEEVGDMTFVPNENINVVIEKNHGARYPAIIYGKDAENKGAIILSDKTHFKNLTVDCKFWYITE